jgi:hypothetical protein
VREELEYNAMNILAENRRWQQGIKPADFTYTRFSTKGALVEKTLSVQDSILPQRKELYFRELGYQTGQSIYKLDAQNRDIEKHYYDFDGYNTLNAFYSYTNTGKIATVKEYAENDSLIQAITYHYDNADKLTDVSYTRQNGFIYKHEMYLYDGMGRISEYWLYENSPSFGGLEQLSQIKRYTYVDLISKK